MARNRRGFAIVLASLLAGSAIGFSLPEKASTTPETTSAVVVAAKEPTKNPALPRTLAGYQRAFDNLPAYEWGGGDVGLTTVLEDGRLVWFFGDTLTRRGGHTGLLRNTALVQTGEHIRAANHGTQIIPTTKKFVYWPVRVDETRQGILTVWMSKIRIWDGGMWNFKRVRSSEARKAKVSVDIRGNMKFLGWTGWAPNPTDRESAPADGSDLRVLGPGHWAYLRIVHYDLPLRDGRHLVTESQNWDNGHKRTVDYRIMLSSQ